MMKVSQTNSLKKHQWQQKFKNNIGNEMERISCEEIDTLDVSAKIFTLKQSQRIIRNFMFFSEINNAKVQNTPKTAVLTSLPLPYRIYHKTKKKK